MRWASAYKLDMKSSHRLVDVPKPQITGILELQPCIPGRGNHRMRDQYATWLCAFLQPGGDVDVVPEDVMWLHKHVTEIYANAEFKPVAAWRPDIPGPNGILEGDCEPDRAGGARELGEESVSSVFDDPRTMQCNSGLNDVQAHVGATRVHAGLVLGHASCITNCIGSEDDRQSWVGTRGLGTGPTPDQS
jgi:hypothetical protein